MVPCPPGLEEFCMLDVPFLWEETPRLHTRSLRKLQLHVQFLSRLDAARLAAMTVLQSLRAVTSETHPAMAAKIVLALTQLTRLDLTSHCCPEYPAAVPWDRVAWNSRLRSTTRSKTQLSEVLRLLSALRSLRHLELGCGFDDDQVLDGSAVFPVLEVLSLDLAVLGNSQFLSFFDRPGRLASVSIRELVVNPRTKEGAAGGWPVLWEFRTALAQRIPYYVSLRVQQWY